jgi:hypothetical protein
VQAFNNNVRDPLRCPVFDATNRDCATSFASYIRANPDLKPEKSDNFTAGFVVQPTRDFAAAIDYWYIKRKDQIDRFAATYLLARESQFPNAIVRDPEPGDVAAGRAELRPDLRGAAPVLQPRLDRGERRGRRRELDRAAGDYGRFTPRSPAPTSSTTSTTWRRRTRSTTRPEPSAVRRTRCRRSRASSRRSGRTALRDDGARELHARLVQRRQHGRSR